MLNIVFFGTPDFVLPILDTLSQHYRIVAVVTAPDTVQGRKKILTPTPVKQFALKENIPVLQPKKLTKEDWELEIRNLKLEIPTPDLFVVAAYGKIIPKAILDIPKCGALNIHPSLLPKYRGPSPIQSALLNGDKTTGVTIIKMDEKMDHGPILMQVSIKISPTHTFENLHKMMFQKAADSIIVASEWYVQGKITPREQQHWKATYCHIVTKQDGYFDINNPPDPVTLDRMIRAYYPWPTVWTKIRIKNQESRIMKLLPGGFIQLEGGKPMKSKELLNGYPELSETIERLVPKSQITNPE